MTGPKSSGSHLAQLRRGRVRSRERQLNIETLQALASLRGLVVLAAAKLRPSTLSAIERSKTKGIDLATLEAIADVLEVEPGFLIVREKARRSGR